MKYKQMLNTLAAVLLAAVGVSVTKAGGDWGAALDGLGVAAIAGLIKVLNPFDGDAGVTSKAD